MRSDRRFYAGIAAVVLGLLAAPRDADAFCRTQSNGVTRGCSIRPGQCCTTGKNLFWPARCTGYSFSTAGSRKVSIDTARTLMREAFDAWQSVTCNETGDHPAMSAVEIDETKLTTVGYDKNGANANVILFRDDQWSYEGDNSLGLTTLSFDVNTGMILDADMELNTSEPHLSVTGPVAPDGFDLETVIVHEAGHFLGLAHSGDPQATMFSHYVPGNTDMSSLELDDAQGICAIYPPSGVRDNGLLATTENCAAPRGGFDNGDRGSVSHGCAVADLAASGRESDRSAWVLVGLGVGITLMMKRRRSA
jgi:hypothetical protein